MAPLCIYPDGTTSEIYPAGGAFTLDEYQQVVQGYIEVAPLPPGTPGQLIVNEEGMIYDLPYNGAASEIACQPIFGTVLYIPAEDVAQYGLK